MTTIASVNGAPVISIGALGDGTLIYMGILEESSDFRLSPAYPIFWHELLKFLTSQADVHSLNSPTGRTLLLDELKNIQTPDGTVRAASLLLDYEGIYEFNGQKVAANLLNERESAINAGEGVGQSAREYELVPVKERREYDLEPALIIAALIILFFELAFIKLRGDL